jgi:hypothetical protein
MITAAGGNPFSRGEAIGAAAPQQPRNTSPNRNFALCTLHFALCILQKTKRPRRSALRLFG